MTPCAQDPAVTDARAGGIVSRDVVAGDDSAPAGRHVLEPPLVAERYRLDHVLGRGAMGTVWQAEDEVLHRRVALKQCRAPADVPAGSLLCEARAAARVTHPGVVCVHDFVRSGSEEWIVMEVLSGRPLSEHIRERQRLPVAEVRGLARQVLDALCALHAAGLVHRDVKPSNLHVCDDGRVVLTDFGLTSASGSFDSADGTVAGSLAYLAPEALREGRFGPPSDLYALGVTIFAAVEGHQPFAATSTMSRIQAVMSEPPPRCRHAGPLTDLVHGLLIKDPLDRTDAVRAHRLLDAPWALDAP